MRPTLAAFQGDMVAGIYSAYRNGARNVMPVLSTGGGKTVIMGHIAHEYEGCGVNIAHRKELVGQVSVALAREGMRHDIIAPSNVIKQIIAAQRRETGMNYYDPRARWKVASVDTLVRRDLPEAWRKQVGMAMIDEGHHVQEDNKWGRALSIFDNAYGLMPTASPLRADGRGLGRGHGGVVDAMVEGPGMRWLIEHGHLTDYEVRGITTDDLDLDNIPITASGELDMVELRKRTKASRKIIGDVVNTYLQFARGKRGITFAVDVEHATQIAAAYIAAGVPAVVVTADTPDTERDKYLEDLKAGVLLQIVNVDLFGEGVDVPAVEVISMARKTESYGLYVQQFGRALRLLVSPILRAAWHTYTPAQRRGFISESLKPIALILDHVGNVLRHGGPPDWRREPWSLEGRTKTRMFNDGIPLRVCINKLCAKHYERVLTECPYCQTKPPLPADRSRPEFVDGDVTLYTQELMEQLFGAKNKIDRATPQIPYGIDTNSPIAQRLRNLHRANQSSQAALRAVMSLYLPPGVDSRINDRRFFHTFGVDTLTAQGLTSAAADELCQRIIERISK